MTQAGLSALSIAAIGGIAFAKYKLLRAHPVWWVIVLGALVFVASTPAKAE